MIRVTWMLCVLLKCTEAGKAQGPELVFPERSAQLGQEVLKGQALREREKHQVRTPLPGLIPREDFVGG